MSNKLIILTLLANSALFSSFVSATEQANIESKLEIIKEDLSKENQKKK